MKEISALEADVQALEERWFELTELPRLELERTARQPQKIGR